MRTSRSLTCWPFNNAIQTALLKDGDPTGSATANSDAAHIGDKSMNPTKNGVCAPAYCRASQYHFVRKRHSANPKRVTVNKGNRPTDVTTATVS